MNRAKPMVLDSLDMRGAGISFVRREIILGILPGILAHKRIALNLRHNGSRCDGSAFPVAFRHVHLSRVHVQWVAIKQHRVGLHASCLHFRKGSPKRMQQGSRHPIGIDIPG